MSHKGAACTQNIPGHLCILPLILGEETTQVEPVAHVGTLDEERNASVSKLTK